MASKEFEKRKGRFKNLSKEELSELGKKGNEIKKKKKEVAIQKEWERINFQQVIAIFLMCPLDPKTQNYKRIHAIGVEEPLMIHWMLYTIVQNGNVQAMQMFIDLVGIPDSEEQKFFELPSTFVDPQFFDLNYDIEPNHNYILEGGRSSGKSTFVSGKIIELMIQNPDINVLAVRRNANDLKDSVYAQFEKTINLLGLDDDFDYKTSPLEITYKPTGQKILFRGADKPTKIKSVAVKKGYIGIYWIEEADQLNGEKDLRTINQSVRGGSKIYSFMTLNRPISKTHWVNQRIDLPDKNTVIHHSSYLNLHRKEWLGDKFYEDAEALKERNPREYEHEYLGIPVGTGAQVFDNLEFREITDQEIGAFDYEYMGIDWGYNPDPFVWVRVAYVDETIYIYDEYVANKKSNKEVWEALQEEKGVTTADYMVADSAEPKSIGDLKMWGANIHAVSKPKNSVHQGIKWMQTRIKIVIDPERCPRTANEFGKYEYEKNKEGEPITAYPDIDNHTIDATRYSLYRIWQKRGN